MDRTPSRLSRQCRFARASGGAGSRAPRDGGVRVGKPRRVWPWSPVDPTRRAPRPCCVGRVHRDGRLGFGSPPDSVPCFLRSHAPPQFPFRSRSVPLTGCWLEETSLEPFPQTRSNAQQRPHASRDETRPSQPLARSYSESSPEWRSLVRRAGLRAARFSTTSVGLRLRKKRARRSSPSPQI